MDRYQFLQSLRSEKPLTKLFCVGDDWQSIYRFAGSDMTLFKHFQSFFGYTKKCFMETTYRFGEPAIAKSSKFILANPDQEKKKVRPFLPDAETELDFIPTSDKDDIADTIRNIADQIPGNKEIMLLGRYSFDINILKGTDLNPTIPTSGQPYIKIDNRKIGFMTVHQSKGLECDYVIILNCNGGTLGFPADIADSPVLRFVLSKPDAYAFSEERRVFYVGITRAKVHTWVLYDKGNPSPFIKEFIKINDNKPVVEAIPPEVLCPKCRCGRLVPARKGIAINGNPYTYYVCSNSKYGCDFQDTVFINLNARPRYKKK